MCTCTHACICICTYTYTHVHINTSISWHAVGCAWQLRKDTHTHANLNETKHQHANTYPCAGPMCLVMASGRDMLIPVRHSHDLAARLGGATELLEFVDNGHMVRACVHASCVCNCACV